MIQDVNASPEAGEGKIASPRRLTVVPTPLRRRAIDLASLADVRREMCRIYRDMRFNRINSQEGTRMTYVLSQIAKTIELGQLQVRVEALQRALGGRAVCK